MIVETSAIVAILKDEPSAPSLAAVLQDAGGAKVSAISMLSS